MKLIRGDDGKVDGVELTRRNLRALLVKLDGAPRDSRCTILAPGSTFFIRAVEDEAHYGSRRAGIMHPETEAKLAKEET